VFAALMSTIAYLLLGDWPEKPQGSDLFYYYDIIVNPLLWFVAGLGAALFTERHLRKIRRQEQELEEAHERENTITDSYNFVKGRKENLETQIAGRLTSSVKAYRAAKAVETLNPKDVLTGIEDLVAAVLNPKKFSVFTLDDNQLNATITHGWMAADDFAKSYTPDARLYQEVIGNKHVLNVVNEDHAAVLNHQGVLCGPILDPDTNSPIGMLKVEATEFTSVSMNTVETFKALCDWIGSSLVNAQHYQTVKEDSVINPDHNLMTFNYFKRQSDYLTSLAKRVGFDLSMIVVRTVGAEQLNDAARVSMARKLSASVDNVLRTVDLAFDYQNHGEEYSILLPATPKEGANIVRDKIEADLARIAPDAAGSFSFIVQPLHEA
jgi:hypothetical protein